MGSQSHSKHKNKGPRKSGVLFEGENAPDSRTYNSLQHYNKKTCVCATETIVDVSSGFLAVFVPFAQN